MSDGSSVNDRRNIIRRPLPIWLAATVIGVLLGGGVTFQVMRAVGYDLVDPLKRSGAKSGMPAMTPPGTGGGGGMGGGMMGGGMMGGGGAREKRSLTALVGKLDLLSKGLPFELDPEQAQKIAAKLAELDQAEKMTSDEAQAHLDAIQAILTEAQKATLASIDLPRGGSSSGSGTGGGTMGGAGGTTVEPGALTPPGSGPPRPQGTKSGDMAGSGAGGTVVEPGAMTPGGSGSPPPPPGTMSGSMMGAGGSPPDENPFVQETNQKRLRDLLHRLRPSSAEAPDVAEGSGATEVVETTEESESPQP